MNPIHNAFPIVASAIGKKANIEIKWGKQACTDGNWIELPYFDPQSERLRRLALGKLLHECGHVRFTDFSIPETPPLHEQLFNIFEDGRIERCMMGEYGGAQKLLKEMAHEVFLGDATPTKDEIINEDPTQKLLNFVLYQQRAQLPGQHELQPIAGEYLQEVENTFPRGAVTRLKGMLTQSNELDSSADAWDLASQVYAMLEQESEEEEKQQQQEDKSLPGAEDGEEGSESTPVIATDAQSDADSSQADNNAAKKAALKSVLKDQNPQAFDIGQAMADELNEGYQEAERTGEGSLGGEAPSSSDNIAENKDDVDTAKAVVNRLRRKLQVALEEEKRVGSFRSRKGRRIDANRLTSVRTGNNRVFRRTEENTLPSASVALLIDRSGSMQNMSYFNAETGKPVSAIVAARQAALGLALTIDSFSHVELAGMAFPGRSSDVLEIQKFGSTARATEGRYGGLLADGGTPLAPALMFAAEQVLSRQNERKIIIVLSDGEPRNPKATESIIERCKQSGIELYGLALQSNALQRFIEDTEYLKDASRLPDTLFSLADRILKR